MINLVEVTFLNQLVHTSTRGINILDLLLTTDSDLVDSWWKGEALANTDHSIIRVLINTKFEISQNKLDPRLQKKQTSRQ